MGEDGMGNGPTVSVNTGNLFSKKLVIPHLISYPMYLDT